MNWDKGFKRLYIALTILFFTATFFWVIDVIRYNNEVSYSEELKNQGFKCIKYTYSNDICLIPKSRGELIEAAISKVQTPLIFWVVFSSIWFLFRWVSLGFKKTASARNWPEGSDE